MSANDAFIVVDLVIDNIYPDDVVKTVVSNVIVPTPASFDDELLEEWAMDHLFEHTGTDRADGDSSYTVTITAAAIPELVNRTFEMG